MAENITTLTDIIYEKTTPKISMVVQDESGVALSSANIDSITLSLYTISGTSYTIINSRDAQNILNANNVSIDTSGILVWSVQELDTQIVDTLLTKEVHRALFTWHYATNTKSGKYIVDFTVLNLRPVI